MSELKKAKLLLWFTSILGFLIAFFFTGVAFSKGGFFLLGFSLIGVLIIYAGINNYKQKSAKDEVISSKTELLKIIKQRAITESRYLASFIAIVGASLAITIATVNSNEYYRGVEKDFIGSVVIFSIAFSIIFILIIKLRKPENHKVFVAIRDEVENISSLQVTHHKEFLSLATVPVAPIASVRWLILKIGDRNARIWITERQVMPIIRQLMKLNSKIKLT